MKIFNYGNFIKRIRKEKGMTQTQLSARSGVSQSNISKIEQCKKGITVEDLELILDVFDLDIIVIGRNKK